MQRKLTILTVVSLLLLLLVSGCGGGQTQSARINGLSADGVVKTFFEAAKAGKYNEASAYIAPGSTNPKALIKYISGKPELDQLKKANLLSLKKVAEEGNYSVVVATFQTTDNSLSLAVKPIGLEKVNGEWYIVDFDKIYQDAKYRLLQQLISNI